MNVVWVGLGGALGSILRYLVGVEVARRWGTELPYSTLAINALGSLLLSALMCVAITTGKVPEAARLGVATGVLGGFTTYSTFNHETLTLARGSGWAHAVLYVGLTVGGCLIAGVIGWTAARMVLAR
jgi:fluoride exporter